MKEKIKLFNEMAEFAKVKNGRWKPDWKSTEYFKHGVVCGANSVFTDFRLFENVFVFGIAVKDEQIAEEMCNKFEKRIKELYNKQ